MNWNLIFGNIWGACKTLCKRGGPLPMRIYSEPWYYSARTFKFAKSEVWWWVTPKSRYKMICVGTWVDARRACMSQANSLR